MRIKRIVFGAVVFIGFLGTLGLTYTIKTQVVSVGTTATKLPATPLVGRKYIRVQNIGSSTLYIGGAAVSADSTSTGGIQLFPYSVWEESYDHTVNVYGIVASGTCNVVVEEGK